MSSFSLEASTNKTDSKQDLPSHFQPPTYLLSISGTNVPFDCHTSTNPKQSQFFPSPRALVCPIVYHQQLFSKPPTVRSLEQNSYTILLNSWLFCSLSSKALKTIHCKNGYDVWIACKTTHCGWIPSQRPHL